MSISEECKAYEKFHQTYYQDAAFPIVKSRLLRYIKFRARNSTFTEFLTNLDKHPQHGTEWLEEMNNDEDIKKLMDLTINLWPRQAKQCKQPLIGIGNVYETPLFEKKFGKYIRDRANQEIMYRERVHVVEGKKLKGFMVTDLPTPNKAVTDSSSNSAINLDRYTPTTRYENNPASKPKSTSTSTSTLSNVNGVINITNNYEPPASMYDYSFDEQALREELMQQMLLPTKQKLVSQFKPKTTTRKSSSKSLYLPSPAHSPSSSSKTIKKGKGKAREESSPLADTEASSASTEKPSAKKKKMKPIVEKKKPVIQTQDTDKDELWNQLQTVKVKIEKLCDEYVEQQAEESLYPITHPVIRITKRRPFPYPTKGSILEPRHPVVRILKGKKPIRPVVRIKKREPIPYGHKHIAKDKQQQEQGQQRQERKYKKQKGNNSLLNPNRMQMVKVVIQNPSLC